MDKKEELKEKFLKAIQKVDVAGTSKGYKESIAFIVSEVCIVYSDSQTKELQSALEKRDIQFINQADTIRNYHRVVNKHFPEIYACSENLDEEITKLKSALEKANEEIRVLKAVNESCYANNKSLEDECDDQILKIGEMAVEISQLRHSNEIAVKALEEKEISVIDKFLRAMEFNDYKKWNRHELTTEQFYNKYFATEFNK